MLRLVVAFEVQMDEGPLDLGQLLDLYLQRLPNGVGVLQGQVFGQLNVNLPFFAKINE